MTYDVVIIGGGAAGLNAALMLTRARRSVLVVDSGEPRNAPAAHLHGFLSRDGLPPRELLEIGRDEVRGYGGEIVTAEVTSAIADGDEFVVSLENRTVRARRLLVTTGLTDELPDLDGLRDRWGRDVLHCPYCHGWEIRDQPVAVLATTPNAMHVTTLVRQWTPHVTLLLHTGAEPTDEEWEQFAARDISVVDGEVAGLEVVADELAGVRLRTGEVIGLRALFVTPKFVARAGVLAGLGITTTEHPWGGSYVASDETGRTSVPGVWVAGNVTDPSAQVITAAAGGAKAAAMINADLVGEDTRNAVRDRRNSLTPH
ncbi:thioredoxin reductase (NADPH) [Herbihabitans rhizosphaerae]|uniref:Thioredoxin reductase (NADPH) n=1 Tax=Herbihabitans rhizosphaerae TaxID=1872711 RepID=A0A4Q7KFH6_9PSEU|nr:NAD(P)/FAD-dependent oxidoreductase [Herbihabitans rhizosphaerae]RZS33962.1 thioredoxin reductase (NADPH) [Herbihabitans rhizosphaerae]